jgi:hypothetical protein
MIHASMVKRRFFPVHDQPPVTSPTDAVRAVISAEQDIIATDTVPAVHKVCIASALGARLTP